MFSVKLNSFQLQVLEILKQVQNDKICENTEHSELKTEDFKVFEILKQVQNDKSPANQ